MREVFADAFNWIALANLADQWHGIAARLPIEIRMRPMVTTEEVLVDFLASLSKMGPSMRSHGVRIVKDLIGIGGVSVLQQSHQSFLSGSDPYERRPDKGYSLTHCISMQVMRERGIMQVLTSDRHFEQECFEILIRA